MAISGGKASEPALARFALAGARRRFCPAADRSGPRRPSSFRCAVPPCHKLNGAGASDVGPDLNLPQNPTEYLTLQGLHDVIRNSRAVRAWPAMAMPSFPPDHLSDREIALVIAYLKHMAGKKH